MGVFMIFKSLIFIKIIKYNIYMLIRQDELAQTKEELRELERLCWEARMRYRRIIKQRAQQSWWDWFWETIGY